MTKQQQSAYRQRREALMASMGAGSVGVWMSAPVTYRTPDVLYPYRQRSDLLYLTGCREPGAILVLQAEQGTSVLFLPERDAQQATWDGPLQSFAEAEQHYGVDEVHPVTAWSEKMTELAWGCRHLVYQAGHALEQDRQILDWMQQARRARKAGRLTPGDILDPAPWLHKMRLYKSDEEVTQLRRAAQATVAALQQAVALLQPGLTESELEAWITYQLRRGGCEHTSFGPIVASGSHATILHYREHKGVLQDGELVLMDVGGECGDYAADMSRTLPVNGVFSSTQREVYQVVIDAQAAAIATCRPGALLSDVHQAAVEQITRGLLQLGVLQGDLEALLEEKAYLPYFPHRTSHWLGLDVHDVGEICESDGTSRVLQPGMVLTVEPGLYFNPSLHPQQVQTPFDGTGVRIEDDILITEHGHDNLTADFPTGIEAIETLMKGQRS